MPLGAISNPISNLTIRPRARAVYSVPTKPLGTAVLKRDDYGGDCAGKRNGQQPSGRHRSTLVTNRRPFLTL
jgi:hypothetical protein